MELKQLKWLIVLNVNKEVPYVQKPKESKVDREYTIGYF